MLQGTNWWPWLVWGIFAVTWTALLLSPVPTNIGPLTALPTLPKIFLAKSLHVAAYAFFIILSAWVRLPMRLRWILPVGVMGHATITELIQNAVGRNGTLEDVAFDHLGVLIGLFYSWKAWIK